MQSPATDINILQVFKNKQGNYLITFPGNRNTWEVDGKEALLGYSNRTLETDIIPKEVFEVWQRTEIDYYQHCEHEKGCTDRLSFESYDRELQLLTAKGDLDICFDNLDDEFNYKRFIRTWNRVFKTIIDKIPYRVVVKELPYSDYAEIQPIHQLGATPLEDFTCVYESQKIKWFREIAFSLGFSEDLNESQTIGMKYNVPTHSLLRFIKINGNYLNTAKESFWENESSFRGSYVECKQKLEEDKQKIRDALNQQLRLIKDKELAASERAIILTKLKEIKSRVFILNVKEKSSWDKRNLLSEMEELIKLL